MRTIAALFAFSLVAGSSASAFADEPPSRPQKDKKKDKSNGCSVTAEDDAMLGLAALVLLVSGVALRRRS